MRCFGTGSPGDCQCSDCSFVNAPEAVCCNCKQEGTESVPLIGFQPRHIRPGFCIGVLKTKLEALSEAIKEALEVSKL